MIKTIIFDWDDVFSKGSTDGYHKCYHKAIEHVGIKLSEVERTKRISKKWGASHQEVLSELLKENPELVDKASGCYEKYFFGNTFTDCLSEVAGGRELLLRLADSYTLALASGVHPIVLKERVMPKLNIPNVFAQIVTAYDIDDPKKAKPHPHTAKEIMKALRVKPSETIMVGDARNDVLMARNAGIEPVVVLTGHLTRREAEKLDVNHIIDDVSKLETVLGKI